MTVRLRLALVIVLTGLATAIGVVAAVVVAFQRFEHENTWQRGDAFLGRVAAQHDDLLDQHTRDPEGLAGLLQNLLLFEPDSQLYLLDGQGTVLTHTGQAQLPRGFRVALAPVQQAVAAGAAGDGRAGAYVMGDDPEHMATDTVVAARALKRSRIQGSPGVEGYLYLVCRKPGLPAERLALLRNSVVMPALASVAAVCLLTALLGAWTIVKVTQPLRVLSDEVEAVARSGFGDGFDAGPLGAPPLVPPRHPDEFTRLRSGFQTLLSTLRMQWSELQRLDRFRRESVSNLSHDLRSPLTATVACLETLEQRWQEGAAPDSGDDDRRLIEVALRNARNAAGMVRSLGDLALLDEPQFQLHPIRLDLAEVMDDIALRFANRAARQAIDLAFVPGAGAPPVAAVDVELFERAVANLLDNALKFTPFGGRIAMTAERAGDSVWVCIQDSGSGIAAEDLPHLFDRLYQSRSSVAPATSDEGKGLGLAIVKRIAELHGGTVSVASTPGVGTLVTLSLRVDLPHLHGQVSA
jgi:signal transduction histidine kinase